MHNKVKQISTVVAIFSLLLLVIACKPTRDRWINRKWHTLTGHYNIYFNGETKFNDAVNGYEKGVQNDFSKVLPVFIIPDEGAAKGLSGSMDEVIKKAAGAIQLHTVGSYTDDAYFLMGRAQYYKRDFFAALETFQYINSKYKDGDLNKISTAWIARCYDGLNKQGEAEAVMGLLISEVDPVKLVGKKKVPERLQNKATKVTTKQRAEIYATAADIYIRQEKYNLAAERLKVALENTREKPLKIRYHYILGQLYLIQDSIQQAKYNFTRVTRLLAPYDFEFNANLNLTRTYNPNDKREVKQVKRNLKRMLNDDKNEGFYDQVYFELAKVEQRDNDLPNAIKHYKLSAAKSVKNLSQKSQSYLALGNIYLDVPDYKLGQAYYDSAAAVIPKENKDYQKVQDKKNVLSELISNILVIETEDSLQRLSALSKNELEQKVDGWILAQKLRQEKEARDAAEKKEIEQQSQLNKPVGTPGLPSLGGDQGQWYFYNTSVMNSGQQEFFSMRKWGRRENEDFWRIASKEKQKSQQGSGDQANPGVKDSAGNVLNQGNATTPKDEDAEKPMVSEDRAAWVKDIPYTAEEKKKSTARIIEAYYNLGLIYDGKIKDYKEAASTYSLLMNRFPGNEHEAEVLYYLFKLYTLLKQDAKANEMKETLIRKYPESNYALILQNKTIQTAESSANKEIVRTYESLYKSYEAGDYESVKQGKKEADKKYSGNVMQGKFDLLYAMAVGKTDSLSVFKAELEDIVQAYPKTDVAVRAQAILDMIKKQGSQTVAVVEEVKNEFEFIPDAAHYYVFATKTEKFDMNDLLQKMINYNEEFHQFENLRVNSILSSEGYQVMYVREFPKLNKAVEYYNGINLTGHYKGNLPPDVKFVHFAISVDHFKKMLKEKKIEEYNTYFNSQLPTLLKQTKQ